MAGAQKAVTRVTQKGHVKKLLVFCFPCFLKLEVQFAKDFMCWILLQRSIDWDSRKNYFILYVLGRDGKVRYTRYRYSRYTFCQCLSVQQSTQEDGNQSKNLSGHTYILNLLQYLKNKN